MADTNVRIKLSADGKQVRDEIKLIDKDLQELGGETTGKKTASRTPKTEETTEPKKQDNTAKIKQESRDKVSKQMLNETTLLRKELQKLNENKKANGGSGGNTPPPSSGSGSTSSPSSPSSGGSGGKENPDNKKLSTILGKVGSVIATVGTTAKILGSLSSMAKNSQSGMSMAYQTYGSTLAYDNYNQARKDASNLGANYGYDYETVMGAGSANMSKGGFTTLENYETDMNQILKTSKAWGIDASNLAGTSGYMTSIGVTESGDQKKFADLLAESIVQAEMTGREDEQLQVLEDIAETLANNASTVTNESLTSSLNLYNALVAQNENLKGTRGSQVVTSMQDLATSGNTSLDILAGFGTQYTGIQGKLELRKLAETDPEQYWKQVYQGYTQRYGEGNMQNFTYFLSNQLGSVTKAEDIVSSLGEVAQGTYDISGTTSGESATDERIQNYQNDKVSTFERKDVETKEMKDDVGNIVNSITAPFWGMFNNLSDGWKTTLGIGTTLGSGWVANKLGGKALGKAGEALDGTSAGEFFSKLFGKGSKGAGVADDAAKAAAGSVDDVAKAAAGSADDVLSSIGKAAAGSSDEVASGVGAALGSADDVAKGLGSASKGASALGKAGKALGIIGTVAEVVSTGIDVGNALSDKDYREAAQETGGGIGSIAGGFGGAAGGAALGAAIGSIVPGLGTAIGGAIGGIIGGIGGGLGGNAIGEAAGEGVYDLATDKPEYTEEQKSQIQRYYDEVSRLYNEQGNNAAQDYTNNVVVPYLQSIGVSQSITDAYKIDVGKPDFMKDVEDSRFGSIIGGSTVNEGGFGGSGGKFGEVTSENTDAIQENTEAIQSLIESNNQKPQELAKDLQEDKGTNSKDEGSTGSWWSNLFKSHAVGKDYVPHDNYLASLHKGEMVLDKFEADQYRQGTPDGQQSSNSVSTMKLDINVNGSIDGMTADNQNQIVQAVVTQISRSGLQGLLSNGFVRVQNY